MITMEDTIRHLGNMKKATEDADNTYKKFQESLGNKEYVEAICLGIAALYKQQNIIIEENGQILDYEDNKRLQNHEIINLLKNIDENTKHK